MIGDRVRWAHTFADPATAEAFKYRGGVVRAAALGPNSQWHVLVQRDDGTYADELATNLAADDSGSVIAAARHVMNDFAQVKSRLVARDEAIARLSDYIKGEGLAEDVFEPCEAAIDLLRTFQAELLSVGAARDTAIADRDEAVSRLTSACDIFKAERDVAVAELEVLKRRKRAPGRVSEDA